MVGLYFKFGKARLIKSGLNEATFRVEEVQEEREEKHDFKHTLAS